MLAFPSSICIYLSVKHLGRVVENTAGDDCQERQCIVNRAHSESLFLCWEKWTWRNYHKENLCPVVYLLSGTGPVLLSPLEPKSNLKVPPSPGRASRAPQPHPNFSDHPNHVVLCPEVYLLPFATCFWVITWSEMRQSLAQTLRVLTEEEMFLWLSVTTHLKCCMLLQRLLLPVH